MKISELIEELEAVRRDRGDCFVYLKGSREDGSDDLDVQGVEYTPETPLCFEGVTLW